MNRAPTDRSLLTALLATLLLAACPAEKKAPPSASPPDTPASQGSGAPPAEPAGAGSPSGALDKGTRPEGREQVDPDGVVRRGVALSAGPAKSIDEILASTAPLEGKSVKLTGRVETVCQKKGCWMEIRGEKPEQRIRVTAQDYGFFVPASAVGKRATVEGVLSVKTLSVAEAQHLADETSAAGKAAPVTAPVREVAVVASGLELDAG